MTESISKEEFAQYDRQIRLWGLNAQKQLRKANVAIIGVGGLGSEIVKNIVLAGVHSVTLIDHRDVCDEDLSSQLLITPDDVGKNIAEASKSRTNELNPNVIVHVNKQNILDCMETLKSFDVVCLTRTNHKLRVTVNKICREFGVKFLCGDVFGFFSFCFLDFGTHKYVNEEVSSNVKENKSKVENFSADFDDSGLSIKPDVITKCGEEHIVDFCSYEDAVKDNWCKKNKRSLRQSSQPFFLMKIIDEFFLEKGRYPTHDDSIDLKRIKDHILLVSKMKKDLIDENFSSFCISVLSPVAAITGGFAAQEIIKAITHQNQPHDNFFLFDGLKNCGTIERLGY